MALKDHAVQANLPANDLERAKRLYAQKLGMNPSSEDPARAWFEAPDGSRFILYTTPNLKRGGHTQMAFRVGDIESEVTELKARGLVFEEYESPALKTVGSIAEVEGGRAAWFIDSEGNTIGIVQLN